MEDEIQLLLEQPDDILVLIILTMPFRALLHLVRTSTEWRARIIALADRILLTHSRISTPALAVYLHVRSTLTLRERYDYLLAAAYILTYDHVRAWRLCRMLARPEAVFSNEMARFCIYLVVTLHATGKLITREDTVTRAEMETIFPHSEVDTWDIKSISLFLVIVVYLLRCNRSIPAIFGSMADRIPAFLQTFFRIDFILTFYVIPYLPDEATGPIQPWLLDYPDLAGDAYNIFWTPDYFTQRVFNFLVRFIPDAKLFDSSATHQIPRRPLETLLDIVLPMLRRSQIPHWSVEQQDNGMRLLPLLIARHYGVIHIDQFIALSDTIPPVILTRHPAIFDWILTHSLIRGRDKVLSWFIEDMIAGGYYDLARIVFANENVRASRDVNYERRFNALEDSLPRAK